MHVQCSACQSTLALPQAIAGPTLIECTGCGHCFTVEPPRSQLLQPLIVPKSTSARQKAAAAGPMTPIILPPRGHKAKPSTGHSYSVVPTVVPAVNYEPYSVQSQPPPPQVDVPVTVLDDEPAVETYTSSEEPAAPPKKKKKTRRFKKKVVDESSDDASSSFGAQLVYGLVVLGIMVVVGAVFGVGKFGWIKTNGLGQFNDKVVAIVERAGRVIERESFMTWNDTKARSVHNSVTVAIQELRNLSVPSEGREFHQAAMQFLQRVDQVFTTEVSALAQLAASGNRRQAEQRAEQIFSELERMENNVIRIQAEMAKRNNIQLGGSDGSNYRRRPW